MKRKSVRKPMKNRRRLGRISKIPNSSTVAIVPAAPAPITQRFAGRVMPREKVELIKRTICKEGDDNHLALLLHVCEAHGLDPIRKQIYAIFFHNDESRKGTGPKDMVLITGIDGLSTMAARDHQDYGGVSSATFTWFEPKRYTPAKREIPETATVKVYRKGCEPIEITTYWEEYAPRDLNDKRADFWNRMPKNQLEKCFSEDTEVLTDKGFVRFSEITDQKILEVTESGLNITDAAPFYRQYSGPMVTSDSQSLNFCVTPDHNMLVERGIIGASDLYTESSTFARHYVPLSLKQTESKRDLDIPDSAFLLAGFAMADASWPQYNQFRIAVSRDWKIRRLRALGRHTHEEIKRDSGRVGTTATGQLIKTHRDKTCFVYRKSEVYGLITKSKKLNWAILFNASQRQAALLVDAWCHFDGSRLASGARRLGIAKVDRLHDFELIAIMAGYSISPPKRVLRSEPYYLWQITISSKHTVPVIRDHVRKNGAIIRGLKLTEYQGRVWCVTVPSHRIVVRRRGLSMVCGQCTQAKGLRREFPGLGNIFVIEEMAQRRQDDLTPSGRQIVDQQGFSPSGQAVTYAARRQIQGASMRTEAIEKIKAEGLWCEKHQGHGLRCPSDEHTSAENEAFAEAHRRATRSMLDETKKKSEPIDVKPTFKGRVELDWTLDAEAPVIRGDLGEIIDAVKKDCHVTMGRDNRWHVAAAFVGTVAAICRQFNYELIQIQGGTPPKPSGSRRPENKATGEARGTKGAGERSASAPPTVVSGLVMRTDQRMTTGEDRPEKPKRASVPYMVVLFKRNPGGDTWMSCFDKKLFPWLERAGKHSGIDAALLIKSNPKHGPNIVGIKSIGNQKFEEDGCTPVIDNSKRTGGTESLFK